MPAYDSADTLGAAARSVLEQGYEPLVLAVSVYPDDAATIAAAEALADKRVVVVRRDGRGIANGRNSALRQVEADLYMFLDSDDSYDADVIARYVEDHRNNPAPSLRYGDWTAVLPSGAVQRRRKMFVPQRWQYEQLLLDNFIATPTVMIDRLIRDEIGGFDERYDHAEDWHLWLRIARSFPLRHVGTNACFYTRTKTSRIFPRSFWQSEIRIVEEQPAPTWLKLAARATARGRYGAYWLGMLHRRRQVRDLLDVRPVDLLFAPLLEALRFVRYRRLLP